MSTTTDSAPAPRRFYRIKEAADILRIGRATLYRRMDDGQLPFVKYGGAVLIPAEAIERIANSARVAA